MLTPLDSHPGKPLLDAMHLDDRDATAPTITIVIETRETVPSEDAGAILEEVARGFDRHV